MLNEFDAKRKLGVTLAGCLLLGFLSFWGGRQLRQPPSIVIRPEPTVTTPLLSSGSSGVPIGSNPSESKAPVVEEVVVHVAGGVRKPGLYRFAPGSRVTDAIDKAGGASDEASLEDVNLAAKLTDGSQLYVPKKSKDGTVDTSKVAANFVGGSSAAKSSHSSTSAKAAAPANSSISLNNASLGELDRLPGVGPSIAQKIVSYRHEHGGFATIEEVQKVKGIGPKKFSQMRRFLKL